MCRRQGRVSSLVKRVIAALLLTGAEVSPVPDGHRSTITILRGLVDVTKLDPAGTLAGPAVKVGALERVSVVGSQPVPVPQKITREAASSLASDFSAVPKNAPAASTEALSAEVKAVAVREALQLVGGTTQTASTSGSGSTTAGQSVNGTVTGVAVDSVTSRTGSATNTLSTVTGSATNTLSTVTGSATNTLSTVAASATSTLSTVTGGVTGTLTGVTNTVTQTVAPSATGSSTSLLTTVTNTVNTVTSPVTTSILPSLLRK